MRNKGSTRATFQNPKLCTEINCSLLIFKFPVFIFYIAANVTTVYYDEKQLNKAKVKINNALIWGAIVVPVYCYLRGSAINKIYNLGGLKSQWVFLCWIGSLFISGIIDVIMYS